MTSTPRVLAIITARGGSKRLPGKNIRLLGNKSLLAWTVEAARNCTPSLYSVVLSTDDEAIATVGRACGAEVPFLRSGELATDTAGSLPVVQHATHFIEQRDGVMMDWVLLLQPTSPLRTTQDIEAAIAISQREACESVVSVCEMPIHPIFAKKISETGALEPFSNETPEHLRRQDATPTAYAYNGAIYLTRRNTLMAQNSFYGKRCLPYVMPQERSVDIDTEFDFRLAELLLPDSNGTH